MSDKTDPARVAAEKIVRIFSGVCNMHVNDILPDIREACDAMRAENDRLRSDIQRIADSAGKEGERGTSGDGHAFCIQIAKKDITA